VEKQQATDATRAEYWEHLYKEADAKRTLLQEKSEKLLLMVAKRDEKINDLEILDKGHRASIREYKHELEKLQADKELNKGIIHGQSEVIDDLRSQLETPINFEPEDDDSELTELKTHNKLMLGMIADRDTKLITQKELINQLSGRIEELDHRHFDDDE
jgi:chromosome segregation ATPase